MSKPIDLLSYKRAKKRKEELEPYLKQLSKLSDFLYENLTIRGSFAILKEVESVRVQYYMEVHELSLILNSRRENNVKIK